MTKAIAILSIFVLLCLPAAGLNQKQDQFSNIPLENPFASSDSPPLSEVKVSGKAIASITNGDFVHPNFSPDGNILAYSKVLVKNNFENTEVLLYNSNTRKTSVLFNSKRAKKYATYKAFVSEMNWISPRRLEVAIGDGDVDSTRLVLDTRTGRILSEKHESFDYSPEPLPPFKERAREQALSLFPNLRREEMDMAVMNSAWVIPNRGIVLHGCSHQDQSICFLDFEKKSVTRLINLPKDSFATFAGGVRLGASIILFISRDAKIYSFLYRDGKIKLLGGFSPTTSMPIEVKYESSLRVVFLLRVHPPSEKGDNPLFMFDGEQLVRIKEYPELHDAAIDRSGRRIVYCYWEGETRHLVVKELSL